MPFKEDTISTTVAKGEVVIDKAHPQEIASAANVGSTGKTGRLPKRLPKKTAIIIGLTPSHEKGIITTVKQMSTK